jgi:hypothetical protein
MSKHDNHAHDGEQPEATTFRAHCCPCPSHKGGVGRREFFGAAALGGVALTGLSWAALSGSSSELPQAPGRKTLLVKPVLTYDIPHRQPQTSWRSWGGIQTEQDAAGEVVRIQGELARLKASADFPVEFLPLSAVRDVAKLKDTEDVKKAHVLLVYAAGGSVNPLKDFGKSMIFFLRHKSGPVSLWYEIISPHYLRQCTDNPVVKGVSDHDVVIDSLDEALWRLRALCGLNDATNSRILAVGGPGAWAQPGTVVPDIVRKKWKADIQTVTYDELGKLIKAARQDPKEVVLAKQRAADYVKLPNTSLETKLTFVENAMLLDQIFRKLMVKANCRAITINSCMGTIMPMAETSACLALSTLNDDGFLAFCESDFVVIPSGMLLSGISGKPMFLNDPTYPHDGIITLAHCTAPRKLDGKSLEPAQIMTHFESDYGAAPKVNMRIGQITTNIAPDFKFQRWVGLLGEIVAHPLLPICRSQIDIKFKCSSQLLAERMPGFHWMTIYGDYSREVGYALRKIPIGWEFLG